MKSASDLVARACGEASHAENDQALTVERRLAARFAQHSSVSLPEGRSAFPGSNTLETPASDPPGMKVFEAAPGRRLSSLPMEDNDPDGTGDRRQRSGTRSAERADTDIYSPASGIGAAVWALAGDEIRIRVR